ncbi:MAG TPA: branched-chain amino acid ABC transporter permease [Streptosporangiaceae bacterium]|nr:branched-chain amino acid ABC transporter permease [Streptosporangiaceae bacterium]
MVTDLVSVVVNTIILGSIYGLVAIGMTLIYGTLRILDMSQGSMVMVGSFIGWGVLVVAGWNPVLAILAAFIATFLLGALTQLVSVQPLMKRRHAIDFEMITFITTFAVAMVLTNLALELLGPFQRNVTPVIAGGLTIHTVDLPYQSVAMAVVSIALMVGLGMFLARSRWGMAIRAVAQDLDAARLMGVPVGRLYPLTMGLASALAGVAGVFLGGLYFASPTSGDLPLLEALIVVIFGGLGSLPGTVYAAYAIGLIQAVAEAVASVTWSLPILYGVILLVLIVRPYGLLGKPSEARL